MELYTDLNTERLENLFILQKIEKKILDDGEIRYRTIERAEELLLYINLTGATHAKTNDTT